MKVIEDFVPFQMAIKLKEKGLILSKEYIFGAYDEDGDLFSMLEYNIEEYWCAYAPTISQVLKWLRDEKKLYLSIEPHLTDFSSTEIMWIWDALYINSDCKFQWHDGEFGFDSYEKATVSAIEYVIDNLI